jgi:hypothetical protein
MSKLMSKKWTKNVVYFCNFQSNFPKLTTIYRAKIAQSGHRGPGNDPGVLSTTEKTDPLIL